MDYALEPEITVLMAVYNADRFLKPAIESILKQTYQDFEFLIINDGSTDKTNEIINSIKDSRIRYFVNDQNMGCVASLNKGLSLARGKFIARMDGDDISKPTRLAQQYKFLNNHPNVAIVGCHIHLINERDEKIGNYKYPKNHNQIRSMLLFESPFAHPCVFFRKDAFLSNNLFYAQEFHYAEDYDLWQRALKILEGANIDEFLLNYRISSNQVTYKNYNEQQIADKKIKNNILKAFNLEAKTIKHLQLLLQEKLELTQADNFSDVIKAVCSLLKANKQLQISDNDLIQKQVIFKLEKIVIFYASKSRKLYSLYRKNKLYKLNSLSLKDKIKSIINQAIKKL